MFYSTASKKVTRPRGLASFFNFVSRSRWLYYIYYYYIYIYYTGLNLLPPNYIPPNRKMKKDARPFLITSLIILRPS